MAVESVQKLNHDLGEALVALQATMENRSWPYVDLAMAKVKLCAEALTESVGPWVDPDAPKAPKV